jgi:hypothetical protein
MDQWYPAKLNIGDRGTLGTAAFLENAFPRERYLHYAELGIDKGATAQRVAEAFPKASLHLFDFVSTLEEANDHLRLFQQRIRYCGNSHRYNNSYNWS